MDHPILDGLSGVLRPGRPTLLLGPPSSGKSSLLKVRGCVCGVVGGGGGFGLGGRWGRGEVGWRCWSVGQGRGDAWSGGEDER